AMPTPMAANVRSIVDAGCVAAQAAAAPMNGAVHGVESTAVMTPKPKLPATVSCRGVTWYTTCGNCTAKNPHIPTDMIAITTPTPIVNHGYWKSWLVAVNPVTEAMATPSPSQ